MFRGRVRFGQHRRHHLWAGARRLENFIWLAAWLLGLIVAVLATGCTGAGTGAGNRSSATPLQQAAPVRLGPVKPMDAAKLQELQRTADRGDDETWIFPLTAAMQMGPELGLDPTQTRFELLDRTLAEKMNPHALGHGDSHSMHQGMSAAEHAKQMQDSAPPPKVYVWASHAGLDYLLTLTQPVKRMMGGIWVVAEVQAAGRTEENKAKFQAVKDYFAALERKDFAAAYDLMSSGFRASLGGKPEGLKLNGIASAYSFEMLPWLDRGEAKAYGFVLELEPGTATNWTSGRNIRFIKFVQNGGAWKLDAMGSG